MSTRKRSARVTQEEVDERISELITIEAELIAQGKKLSTQDIMKRFGVSARQALRYKNRVSERTKQPLEPAQGYQIAQTLLTAIPLISSVLKDDLEKLNAMSGETESETLALIKARRDQSQAIARFGSQFLKELRELGLISKASNGDEQNTSARTNGESALEETEMTSEFYAEVEQELLEFQRGLEEPDAEFV